MKVALVHDYLKEYGGAERVLEALREIYPQAPIYTAFAAPNSTALEKFKDASIITSWANPIIRRQNLFSPLRFLTPLIWESFDFSGYDLVISSASWYITKSIITKPPTVHVCYCHTPPRWLYNLPTGIEWQRYWPVKIYGQIMAHFLRLYDYLAAQRVDHFIANSKNVQKRIKKFYRRGSTLIYPPIEVEKIAQATQNLKPKDYYLIVSRVVGAKGLDLAIKTANKLKINLKIVGQPAGLAFENRKLQKLKGSTVEFTGWVSDAQLYKLYGECRAYLALAENEDFGMTVVEAQAAGRPVIAFRGGGYLETVVENKTGLFFDRLTVDFLAKAIKHYDDIYHHSKKFQPAAIRRHAQKFSKRKFQKEIKNLVSSKIP